MLSRRERAQLKGLQKEQKDQMITDRAARKFDTGKKLNRKREDC